MQENKISTGKDKLLPTYNELHPVTRFIENRIVRQLNNNKQFKSYLNNSKISWTNHIVLVRNIYLTLIGSGFYKKYLSNPENDYDCDRDLIIKIYKYIILNSHELNQLLEELSIFWNDDIEFVTGMIIKTLKNMTDGLSPDFKLFELFKNDEDHEFTKTLFRKTILHHNENKMIIDKFTKNWDIDRIAIMDVLILEMAIVEITGISSIPVKVSFNEYIEIAKYYSTDKSSNFINGILDKIINSLKAKKKIKKRGKGLMEGSKGMNGDDVKQ